MAAKSGFGAELTRLLHPVKPAEFLSRYWAKETLHLEGKRSRFQSLFDKRRFWKALEALDSQGADSRGLIRAHWGRLPTDDGTPGPFSRVNTPRARAALKKGASLCVNVISDGDRGLYELAAAIKRQLGYPGLVRFNAYYSPHEGGLPVHFDARIAWVVQLSGSKHWWFTQKPVVDWPRDNADRNGDGTALYVDGRGASGWEEARPSSPDDFTHVVLEPGDCLIMPAGVWHQAQADHESLALTLCFDPVTPLDILYTELSSDLRATEAWRACAPMQRGGGKLLVQRTRELARQLGALANDERRLEEVWSRLIGR
jgi:hypothetical protein